MTVSYFFHIGCAVYCMFSFQNSLESLLVSHPMRSCNILFPAHRSRTSLVPLKHQLLMWMKKPSLAGLWNVTTASCDCCSPSCCAAHATRPPLSTNAAHAGLICACFAHVAVESLPIFKLQIQHHLLYECDISCTVLSYSFQMGMYL